MYLSKSLDTLVEDIYGVLGSGKDPTPQFVEELGEMIKSHIVRALSKPEPTGALRGSQMGEQCDRKTWYQVNDPGGDVEELDGKTKLKFLSGHIFEEIVLYLARESGHRVEHEQREVDINGIKGHIDAVVDGTLVDVKTSSSFGLSKFRSNGLRGDDPFGYLEQISFYRTALLGELEDKKRVAFLAISREQCEIELDVYEMGEKEQDETLRNVKRKQTVAESSDIPNRGYIPEPDGASGNYKLPTKCVYCPQKFKCWAEANNGVGLRVFDYAGRARYLTSVVKLPKVTEIT